MHAVVVQINQDCRSRREAPRVCLVALIAYKRRPFSKAERYVAQQETVDRRAGCAVAAGRRRFALLVYRQATSGRRVRRLGCTGTRGRLDDDDWNPEAGGWPAFATLTVPTVSFRAATGTFRRVDMDRRTAGPAGVLVATWHIIRLHLRANSSFACPAIPRSPLRPAICRRLCRWQPNRGRASPTSA